MRVAWAERHCAPVWAGCRRPAAFSFCCSHWMCVSCELLMARPCSPSAPPVNPGTHHAPALRPPPSTFAPCSRLSRVLPRASCPRASRATTTSRLWAGAGWSSCQSPGALGHGAARHSSRQGASRADQQGGVGVGQVVRAEGCESKAPGHGGPQGRRDAPHWSRLGTRRQGVHITRQCR